MHVAGESVCAFVCPCVCHLISVTYVCLHAFLPAQKKKSVIALECFCEHFVGIPDFFLNKDLLSETACSLCVWC